MSTQVVSGNQYYNKVEDTVVTTSKVIHTLRDIEPFSDIKRYKTKLIIPSGTSATTNVLSWLYDADATLAPISVAATPPTDAALEFKPNDRILYVNVKVSTADGVVSPVSTAALTVLVGVDDPTAAPVAPSGTSLLGSVSIDTSVTPAVLGGTDTTSGPTADRFIASPNVQPCIDIGAFGDITSWPSETLISVDFVVISVP